MTTPTDVTAPQVVSGPPQSFEWPPGDHPLEIAARRGIGPLSALGGKVWHGDALPCVSCGQLVTRGHLECDECGQDLTPEMLEKMRAHAGPWYVLEHVRPFPGVTLERIIRQIQRGLLTATSIVRGPASDFQWKFAVETPGLCRYFGRCWSCHDEVAMTDEYCRACLAYLGFERNEALSGSASPVQAGAVTRAPSSAPAKPVTPAQLRPRKVRSTESGQGPSKSTRIPPTVTAKDESVRVLPAKPGYVIGGAASAQDAPPILGEDLRELSAAIERVQPDRFAAEREPAPRLFGVRAGWIVVAMMAVVVGLLLWVTNTRLREAPTPPDSAVTIDLTLPPAPTTISP